MTKATVAVVQAGSIGDDTPATVAKAVELIAQCRARGVQLAVFPEAFIGGHPKGANFDIYIGARTPEGRQEFETYHAQVINVPCPETDALGKAANAARLYLVMGVIERASGTLYCTALFFGPDGALLGKHRKTMPTAAERLCWGFGDGSTLTTVDTPWGKMGSVICWENYMPLLRMAMYDKGISIYCAPTADDRDSWASTMQHIALEGRCFVLPACQYLTRENFSRKMRNRISNDKDHVLMRGGSVIISPLGEVLAGPNFEGETILTAEIDPGEIVRSKFDFDPTGHYARPDIFSLVVDEHPPPRHQNLTGRQMVFHIEYPRVIPAQRPEGHEPAAPRFTLRWERPVGEIACEYFAIQARDPSSARQIQFLDMARHGFAETDGPSAHEVMSFQDEAGYTNAVAVGYWTDATAHARWSSRSNFSMWVASDEPLTETECGYWRETILVPYDRHETVYSAPGYRIGLARTPGSVKQSV
jgi:nitrilase